jgi:Ca-activated chloride channel family protein
MPIHEHSQPLGPCAATTGEPVHLAMQALWLAGTVVPAGARLVVRHVFESREQHPLEVVYAFALPRDAAMRRFRIVGEDFETHSELRPADEAARLYEDGIESGHLSALARAYGDGVVNLSVGNVRPGETVSVYLEIAAGVELRDDGFRFRFPFTLAPGYHPRAAASLSDSGDGEMALPEDEFGDVLLPPWRRDAKGLHQVGFDLSLELPGAALSIASPSHPIAVRNDGPAGTRVQLAVASDVPNRDLVLDVAYPEKKPVLLSGVDSTGKGRVVAIVPSTCFGEAQTGPRRVVFLIDRSGSMGGEPIRQALRAVEACLGALTEQDHFGIVAFDDRTETLASALLPADREHREAANRFVSRIGARGGTELAAGVEEAARVLGPAGGDVVLLTDGQVFGGEAILARARRAGIRVHCLGIGSASQDRFLALVARETGGTSRFVTPRERVDMALLEVFSGIGSPVATGLTCKWQRSAPVSVAPEIPGVVYGGSPLVVMGSFEGPEEGVLRLSWDRGTDRVTLDLALTVASGPLGETLRVIQGARLITDAESRMAHENESPEEARNGADLTNKALLRLSAEFELASRAMALVAVVHRTGDAPGVLPSTRVVPVGLPQDVHMEGYFTPSAAPMPRACSASLMGLAKSWVSPRASAPLQASDRSVEVDEDLGIPAFLRKRMRRAPHPDRGASQPGVLEDLLVDLASAIQPDGGAPGSGAGQRIAASVLLMLLFHQSGQSASGGAFSGHVRQLRRFLEQTDRSGLDVHQTAALARTLELMDGPHAIPGPWEHLARAYACARNSWLEDEFWKTLTNALQVMNTA